MRIISERQLGSVLGALAGTPRVVAGGNFAAPRQALAVLDGALARYRLFALNAQPGMPDRPGVTLESPFVGPGMRGRRGLRYFPCRLSLVPALLADALPPDVVLIQTSVPSDGTVSLGTEVNVLPAAIEAVRARGGLVIAQLNPRVPYTYGDAEVPCDVIDYAIEAEAPLPSPPERSVSDASAVIGDRVAALIGDGATVQAGIGAVPDAVLARLDGRRGLAVWSEMFSDGVLGLAKAGALDPGQPVTASFAFGSADLYAWMDRNPDVRMLRTETVNDPAKIARCRRMTSVNSALQVDLFAQANATWVGGQVHSGFGGQTDFVVGALHSRGGMAIIALPSWHPKADVSTVVARLDGPVTSFQHSYIVSEQGTATIWGRDMDEQAGQIIEHVAHPAVRQQLRAAGRALGLRPVGALAGHRDDRDRPPGVVEQRVLDPADGRAAGRAVVPADHDEVGAGGVAGQHVGGVIAHHVPPGRHGGVLVMPGLQRLGQGQVGLGVDMPGSGGMDGDQGGAAQRGLLERVPQGVVGVARVADADHDLAVHGTRLFPDHDDGAGSLHGGVPADRAEQHRGEPAGAARAHHEHERAGAALGDRQRGRPGQQVGVDELPRRDLFRPRDGFVERTAGFPFEPGGGRRQVLGVHAHARQQGGGRHDPQRRPVPPRLQRGPFHRAQRFLRTVHARHDWHPRHHCLLTHAEHPALALAEAVDSPASSSASLPRRSTGSVRPGPA